MRICAWNVGNQARDKGLNTEAIDAVLRLDSQLAVLCEYCANEERHGATVRTLHAGGLGYSAQALAPSANGIFIASQYPLREVPLDPPHLDAYSATAALAVQPRLEGSYSPTIIGVRVPYWDKHELPLCAQYWDWFESKAAALSAKGPVVIIGDLNVTLRSNASRGGEHFRRMLNAGWVRAEPIGSSLAGMPDGHQIDHALLSSGCVIHNAALIHQLGEHYFCGGPDAYSDHAALVVGFSYPGEPSNGYLYDVVDEGEGDTDAVRETMRRTGLTDEQIKTIT